jgi:hypothetical protein
MWRVGKVLIALPGRQAACSAVLSVGCRLEPGVSHEPGSLKRKMAQNFF